MRTAALAREPRAARWKGKERDFSGRDDVDPAGTDGVLLDVQLINDSPFQAVYVVPIYLGAGPSKYLVQVDTGSSDLWLASNACTSSICSSVGSHRYDPSQSLQTGQSLQIQYAHGEADGPIVWDAVQFGGYGIDHQALVAATDVNSEPLSASFNGILGLALPSNSLISRQITPTASDAPDGATLPSNLFGITPLSTAPGSRFFSLALERPGSARVPSILGIGRHPTDLVPDPSKIEYAVVYTPPNYASSWWHTTVRGISVFVDGVRKPISFTTSTPTAILDSGVPLIITTPAIANGIYGALGVQPASDGNYYLPCTTPLNMTIQLDDRTEIPLHPLDLTYYPPSDASAQSCISSIQTFNYLGIPANEVIADMILGVPFLRNTYMVMAYDEPYANGSFPSNSANSNMLEYVRPHLGLLGLTDPATAAAEFHQVRVLKQSLGSPSSTSSNSSGGGGKGLSVGIEVLIGLLSFFGLCLALFGMRWVYMKRKFVRERAAGADMGSTDGEGSASSGDLYAYHLTANIDKDYSYTSEDELRQRRYNAYKRRHMDSQYTDDTGITFVEDGIGGGFSSGGADARAGAGKVDEFGALKLPETPRSGLGFDATLFDDTQTPTPSHTRSTPTPGYFDVLPDTPKSGAMEFFPHLSPPPRTARLSSSSALHARTLSGGPGPDAPLLSSHHRRSDSIPVGIPGLSMLSYDIAEFGGPMDMAGVGSARGRRVTLGGSPISPFGPLPAAQRPLSHDSRTPSQKTDAEVIVKERWSHDEQPPPQVPSSTSPLSSLKLLPLHPPVASQSPSSGSSERALDASVNASRVSLHGHES